MYGGSAINVRWLLVWVSRGRGGGHVCEGPAGADGFVACGVQALVVAFLGAFFREAYGAGDCLFRPAVLLFQKILERCFVIRRRRRDREEVRKIDRLARYVVAAGAVERLAECESVLLRLCGPGIQTDEEKKHSGIQEIPAMDACFPSVDGNHVTPSVCSVRQILFSVHEFGLE